MDIFKYDSYKAYVLDRVQAMPRGGHGQFRKIAEYLRVTPVLITQVLRGERHFSEEQSIKLSEFLGLQQEEIEYFMRLVALEKAGTVELKTYHREGLQRLRKKASQLKKKVAEFRELDDSAKSVFYSDWIYSAVRLLTSIPQYKTAEAIAERLSLGRTQVNEILEFLLQVGLCRRNSRGDLELGIVSTHLDARSRFVNNHRRNWRLKALEGLNKFTGEEIFYSAPCTISLHDFAEMKEELMSAIASLTRRVPKSKPEALACLNIDWFKVV